MKNQTGPEDFLGQQISAGDWVVYPHRWGSSLAMQIGYISFVTLDGRATVHKVEHRWNCNGGAGKSFQEVRVAKGSVMQVPDRAVVISVDRVYERYVAAVREAGL